MTFADLAIALAHPARETIINLLEDGTTTMGDLAQQLGLCPASVCHHVDVLERVGLARRCRRGRSMWVEATCIPEIVLHPVPVESAPEATRPRSRECGYSDVIP